MNINPEYFFYGYCLLVFLTIFNAVGTPRIITKGRDLSAHTRKLPRISAISQAGVTLTTLCILVFIPSPHSNPAWMIGFVLIISAQFLAGVIPAIMSKKTDPWLNRVVNWLMIVAAPLLLIGRILTL